MAERIRVSAERIIDVTKEVVAERPEYVYVRPEHMSDDVNCYYVHTPSSEGSEPTPGCMFGEVFSRLGVPLADLAKQEGASAEAVARRVLTISAADGIGSLEIRQFLSKAQAQQDDGVRWDQALEVALNTLRAKG